MKYYKATNSYNNIAIYSSEDQILFIQVAVIKGDAIWVESIKDSELPNRDSIIEITKEEAFLEMV